MRTTISLVASLLVLAACGKDDSPKGSAFVAPPAPVVGATAAKAADPDFSPGSSILFRECRQAYSITSCTCTVKMVKEGVDDDTYRTMKSMGITGALATKGAAGDTLRAVLSKAYDACAKAEDDATSIPAGAGPKPQSTFQPTPSQPTAKATGKKGG